MRKLYITILSGLLLGLSSCADMFLDLEPQDQRTDVVYFKKPADFKEYATGFYNQLLGWRTPYGKYSIYEFMDSSSDLAANFVNSSDVGRGTISVSSSDERWDKCYSYIRTVNILFEKAKDYPGNPSEIAPYLAEAYFFRAYNYFTLLKAFGGVPVVTSVMDTDSPELRSSRNSRYEVVDLILSDLTNAIAALPIEQNISEADKGRVSKWAAEAFKARVLLYEATWRKYNGTSTDFEGSAGPARDQVNEFLEEAISLCDDVMKRGGYQIWNYNSNEKIKNQSNLYLFNLEDAGSNPAGLTKSSNKEFILYGVYDINLRTGGVNLSHTVMLMIPSRKLIDMFLCTDGKPIDKSDLFQGYHKTGDEFKNRDYRLMNYINGGVDPTPGSVTLDKGLAGYDCAKFKAYNYPTYRKANDESANYPVLRLAEVYLNYAEAVMERYGEISDDQLNKSINKIRARAGIANLTNALAKRIQEGVPANASKTVNQVMLDEIRRERALELYMEGFRCDDLKRWGIAEKNLNESRCGAVVGNASYPTAFIDENGNATSAFNPAIFTKGTEEVETGKGKLPCVVLLKSSDCAFTKGDYLWAIPRNQINLNSNLVQNPGY